MSDPRPSPATLPRRRTAEEWAKRPGMCPYHGGRLTHEDADDCRCPTITAALRSYAKEVAEPLATALEGLIRDLGGDDGKSYSAPRAALAAYRARKEEE